MLRKTAFIALTLAVCVFMIGCGTLTNQNSNTAANRNTITTVNDNQNSISADVPEELIGTWKSECLTPDTESPWSEQHQFMIDNKGWGTHTRWDWDQIGCGGNMNTQTTEYLLNFPTAGQVDLVDMGMGLTIYDIYALNGAQLLFGHGFRNTLPSGKNNGDSGESRIDTLNNYIQYTKID